VGDLLDGLIELPLPFIFTVALRKLLSDYICLTIYTISSSNTLLHFFIFELSEQSLEFF
jgi:hypothetical protein